MAFRISKAQQPSFSVSEKLVDTNHQEYEDTKALGASPISSQLYLKPSAQAMDKDVILKRIRHHKTLNKVRNTIQALVGSRLEQEQQKWLDPDDIFSSPWILQ